MKILHFNRSLHNFYTILDFIFLKMENSQRVAHLKLSRYQLGQHMFPKIQVSKRADLIVFIQTLNTMREKKQWCSFYCCKLSGCKTYKNYRYLKQNCNSHFQTVYKTRIPISRITTTRANHLFIFALQLKINIQQKSKLST